jgi:hypothetical protein
MQSSLGSCKNSAVVGRDIFRHWTHSQIIRDPNILKGNG